MSILKCKMCGGDLEISEGMTVCECEYCGSKQTISNIDDEKIMKLYDRANRLRMANEFDKALGVYESIVEESDTEAEAYWGLILCKYGIEYVDDPASGDKIPTCHRVSFESVMDDPDFELVMENADALSKSLYRESAKQIEEIRKGIIEVSGKEEPYDIFICYKETADDGDRTIDSVMAQEVYDALTDKGYRVFFSRISLEDKLGQEYEPYIFAALNSAKIMLAFGTSYDYYNAVWVKNEWSRYIKLMAKDKEKHLIPCYKDIDAYDMPKEFKHLQAQDMGKVGAVQDLLRGIEKILPREDKKTQYVQQAVAGHTVAGNNIATLLKRGEMALADGEWEKADGFYEKILDQDAECAEAYLGKLFAEKEVRNFGELEKYYVNKFDWRGKDKKNGICFDPCEGKEKHVNEMVERYKIDGYFKGSEIRALYKKQTECVSIIPHLKEVKNEILKEIREEKQLSHAKQFAKGEMSRDIENMMGSLPRIFDDRITEIQKKEDAEKARIRSEYEEHVRKADESVKAIYEERLEERYKKIIADFNKAGSEEKYESVKSELKELGDYKDAADYIKKCDERILAVQETNYKAVIMDFNNAVRIEDYEKVKKLLEHVGDYKDASDYIKKCDEEVSRIQDEEELERQRAYEKRLKTKELRKKKIIFSVLAIAVAIVALVCICKKINEIITEKENARIEENAEIEEKKSKITEQLVGSTFKITNHDGWEDDSCYSDLIYINFIDERYCEVTYYLSEGDHYSALQDRWELSEDLEKIQIDNGLTSSREFEIGYSGEEVTYLQQKSDGEIYSITSE